MKKKWLSAAIAASLGVAFAGASGVTASTDTTEPAGTEPAGTEPAGTESPTGSDAPAVDPASIATDVGVTEDTISVGMLADLSGAFAPLVTQIVEAQEVYWEQVNADGGIAGRQVELIVEDNAYEVPVQLEKYEAIRNEVAIISQSTGSPHTSAIAQQLVDDDLVAIPLSWYSGWADPDFGANALETYATYCVESMNGIEWLHTNRDVQTVALISFPGEYGGDGDAGARMAAEQLGLEIVYDGAGRVTQPTNDNPEPDVSGIIQDIVDSNPDLVWTTINPGTLARIMGGAVGQGYQGLWSGNVPSFSYLLLGSELAPLLDQYYITSGYTVTWGEDVPEMAALQEAMAAGRPDLPPSDAYVFGWTEAQTTHAILEQAAANGDMTRAGIVAAAKEVTVDYNGLAPTQTWSGEANDYIVRETYMYDVDLAAFDLTPMGEGEGDTGTVLLEGPYTGELAANFVYEGPCYEPTS
jgi:ABC-type branched-subunit amino acid transport system substrate-binding protein